MKFPYDSKYFPPAPVIEVRLGAPNSALSVGPFQALIDSGADATIVPIRMIESLGLQVDNRKFLVSPWGERRQVDVYLLDVQVGKTKFPVVEIVADDYGNEFILGRNVLNKLAVLLDGPNTELDLRE